MRPKRPVPSGCCQKARLRRCSACAYSRYALHLAPSIHRFLAVQRIRESKSDRLLSRAPLSPAFLHECGDGRDQRHHDYADDDERQVLLDPRDVAEQIPRIDQRRDPEYGADDVEAQEAAVRHARDPGEERREGPDDRHETADDDRDAAVFVVERLRLAQVLLPEPARIRPLEDFRADVASDRVVGRIAEDRRDHEQGHEYVNVEPRGRHHGAGDEQDRVAGQERKDDEPRLGENDREQQSVEPRSVLTRDARQRLVEREQRVEERRQHLDDYPAYGRIFSPAAPVFFSGLTRSSRDTPIHMTSVAITSADE